MSQLGSTQPTVPPGLLVATLVHHTHLPPTATCLIANLQSPAWHSFHPTWGDTTASIVQPIMLLYRRQHPPQLLQSKPSPLNSSCDLRCSEVSCPQQAHAALVNTCSFLTGTVIYTAIMQGYRTKEDSMDVKMMLPATGQPWTSAQRSYLLLRGVVPFFKYKRSCSPRRPADAFRGRPSLALGVYSQNVSFIHSMAGPAVCSSSAAS